MRIHTTRQGITELNTLRELWGAQARYLRTTLRRYTHDLPSCLHCVFARLRYLRDPPGRDTWLTPAEAFQAGGDDCEGLANILAAWLLLHRPAPDGLPAAVPALAKFGNGRVIHAVPVIHKDVLHAAGLEAFAWSRYPLIYPDVPDGYQVVDPSWMGGMPFPVRYAHLVQMPAARRVLQGTDLLCLEELPCTRS